MTTLKFSEDLNLIRHFQLQNIQKSDLFPLTTKQNSRNKRDKLTVSNGDGNYFKCLVHDQSSANAQASPVQKHMETYMINFLPKVVLKRIEFKQLPVGMKSNDKASIDNLPAKHRMTRSDANDEIADDHCSGTKDSDQKNTSKCKNSSSFLMTKGLESLQSPNNCLTGSGSCIKQEIVQDGSRDDSGKPLIHFPTDENPLLPVWEDIYVEVTEEQFLTGKYSIPIPRREKTAKVKYFNYLCNQCKVVFTKISDYHRHVKKTTCIRYEGVKLPHESIETLKNIMKRHLLKCMHCNQLFTTRLKLTQHVRAHGENFFKSCEFCGLLFRDLYALRRHVTITKKEDAECTKCGKRFASKCEVKKHLACLWPKHIVCTHCDAAFVTKQELRSHTRFRHCFPCSFCRNTFPTASEMQTHKEEIHSNTNCLKKSSKHSDRLKKSAQKLCPVCGKDIKKASLKEHLYTHSQQKSYQCDQCPAAFISMIRLRSHIKTHKNNTDRTLGYQCEFCGKKFTQQRYLSTHLQWHTGMKFKCSFCTAAFNRATTLKYHVMRLHSAESCSFPCLLCDHVSRMKADFISHMELHKNEKKFCCTLCSSRFNRGDYLAKHMAVHEKIKPYSCHQCPSRFPTKKSLRYHLNKHHGDKNKQHGNDINLHTASTYAIQPRVTHPENSDFKIPPLSPSLSELTSTLQEGSVLPEDHFNLCQELQSEFADEKESLDLSFSFPDLVSDVGSVDGFQFLCLDSPGCPFQLMGEQYLPASGSDGDGEVFSMTVASEYTVSFEEGQNHQLQCKEEEAKDTRCY